MTICDPMCPFLSCPRCKWQGGDTPREQGPKLPLTWENVGVSGPRDAPTSEGLAGTYQGGPTGMTISAPTLIAPSGGP